MTKTCITCEKKLPIEEFPRAGRARGKQQWKSRCSACYAGHRKPWAEATQRTAVALQRRRRAEKRRGVRVTPPPAPGEDPALAQIRATTDAARPAW